MFNRILVPLDGSKIAECVLPHLASIARAATNPHVTLISVLELGVTDSSHSVDAFEWQLSKAETESYLKDVITRLGASGIEAEGEILEGRAAEAIIEYARDHQIDLILLCSHGKSGISGWNVSGVVQKIIYRARTSIMIVRAYQPGEIEGGNVIYRRIMLPLDGSARAEVVFAPAEMLSRAMESKLLAVTVVQRPTIARRMPLTNEDTQLIERLVERSRAEANIYLTDLESRIGAPVETRLEVEKSAVAALHRISEEEAVDLVIMSAHGNSGETRWPYGSNVVSFVSYGTTPLLIVQDLAPERIEMSKAEIAAREQGRR